MKRLLTVAAVTLLAALALALLASRRPLGNSQEAAAAPPPVHQATAELTAQGLQPPKVRVPKDHEIHLLISAAPEAPEGLLTVVGYEDRIEAMGMGPGLAREIVFLSDRPGDDFAFRLGGEIVGRLEVTGSHLVEGHE